MPSLIRWIGNLAILAGFIILFLTFAPLIMQELTYRVRPSNYYQLADGPRNEILNINPDKIIHPVNNDFSIVIPKINANSTVIRNVNPDDPKEYQVALTKGVAHAAGTSLPSETGNMFLFSHSAGNFWEASKYNADFFLLNKMEENDDIYIFYNNRKYHYLVTGKKIVTPSQVKYLNNGYGSNSLVLMTCWPPGTTLKRVIVEAQKQPS